MLGNLRELKAETVVITDTGNREATAHGHAQLIRLPRPLAGDLHADSLHRSGAAFRGVAWPRRKGWIRTARER